MQFSAASASASNCTTSRPDHGGAGRQHEQAASILNTTQPAVSKSIKELERTVGVRLLERSAQGVEPTLYGRACSMAERPSSTTCAWR